MKCGGLVPALCFWQLPLWESPKLRTSLVHETKLSRLCCIRPQARSNVAKRLDFIRRELERLDTQAGSLAEKQARKQQQVRSVLALPRLRRLPLVLATCPLALR